MKQTLSNRHAKQDETLSVKLVSEILIGDLSKAQIPDRKLNEYQILANGGGK